MIVARNIHKKFGSIEVLKGVDIEVNPKEVISIVGASGAGKTTLLQILGTLELADKGEISFNGKNISDFNKKGLAKFRNSNIGFIFQFHRLLPEFTALENVCIPGFIKGDKRKVVENRAIELLQFLGLDNRMDHKPTTLSGGEQQRVAVARALINSPNVILADEPTGNLDSKNAGELHDLFLKLRDEMGQTFVIVTHNDKLAQKADRVLNMKDGKIL